MRTMIAAGLLGVALVPGMALADSPFDGTWKEDVASAKMAQEPDVYLLKNGTFSCKSCVPSYSVKADGTDQPVSGSPYYDTISVNASDQHNIVLTEKKGGKTIETLTFKVAPDDKTINVDFSGTSANGTSYNGTGGLKRVAKGPKGSGAISGSWMRTGLSNASDSLVTVTYKVDGDTLTMSDPTGDTYTAKMNGTEAPVKGNPGVTTVSVKKLGSRTMMETDMRDGKVIETVRSTVGSNGKTMTVVDTDKLRHRTTTYKATKQ
ncbi:MAG TPA: hypothetical protein VHT03_15885 [Rhizomicrobium sp.]|nr:hypothetical protein [Rhizomicrobium sp.]